MVCFFGLVFGKNGLTNCSPSVFFKKLYYCDSYSYQEQQSIKNNSINYWVKGECDPGSIVTEELAWKCIWKSLEFVNRLGNNQEIRPIGLCFVHMTAILMYFFCMEALNQKATYIGTKLLTGPVSELLCTEQSQFCNFSYVVLCWKSCEDFVSLWPLFCFKWTCVLRFSVDSAFAVQDKSGNLINIFLYVFSLHYLL